MQMPNSWSSPAGEGPASVRVKKAGRARLSGYTGTTQPLPLRRYFSSTADLAHKLRRRQRRGIDVAEELRGLGSVYVRKRNGWAQIEAREAIRFIETGTDISPPHTLGTVPPRGSSLSGGACPGEAKPSKGV